MRFDSIRRNHMLASGCKRQFISILIQQAYIHVVISIVPSVFLPES